MLDSRPNKPLILGALFSAVAALAHLGCIIFGGDWYRFFGAGEQMAKMASQLAVYRLTLMSLIWSRCPLLSPCSALASLVLDGRDAKKHR